MLYTSWIAKICSHLLLQILATGEGECRCRWKRLHEEMRRTTCSAPQFAYYGWSYRIDSIGMVSVRSE